MLESQRIMIAKCDEEKDDQCLREIVVGLEPEETFDEAMEFLEDMGWTFDSTFYVEGEEIKVCCPNCLD